MECIFAITLFVLVMYHMLLAVQSPKVLGRAKNGDLIMLICLVHNKTVLTKPDILLLI